MSKVYKWDEIVLSREKIVRFKNSQTTRPTIDKALKDKKDHQSDIEDPKAIIDKAKERANAIIRAAEIECEETISRTRTEQQTIISEAYEESNNILENSRKKGYEQGVLEGREEGLRTVDNLIEEVKQMKQNVLSERKTVAKELEKQVIELIISCVKKILNHELERNHKLLLNLVENGIEKCTYTDSLIIRVGENDYETVNSSKNKIYIMTEGIDNIEVKKDPALEDGSIIIETVSGTVDASLQTQITQIEQMFYEILGDK